MFWVVALALVGLFTLLFYVERLALVAAQARDRTIALSGLRYVLAMALFMTMPLTYTNWLLTFDVGLFVFALLILRLQGLRTDETRELCSLLVSRYSDWLSGSSRLLDLGRRSIRVYEIDRELYGDEIRPPEHDQQEATFRWRLYRIFGAMVDAGAEGKTPAARERFKELLAELAHYRRDDTADFIDSLKSSAETWLKSRRQGPWQPGIGVKVNGMRRSALLPVTETPDSTWTKKTAASWRRPGGAESSRCRSGTNGSTIAMRRHLDPGLPAGQTWTGSPSADTPLADHLLSYFPSSCLAAIGRPPEKDNTSVRCHSRMAGGGGADSAEERDEGPTDAAIR